MKVQTLPPHLEDYYLAVFDYCETELGVVKELQIVKFCDGEYCPMLDIGYDGVGLQFIPCVIEKTFDANQKYLDWNPEFEAEFFANFGMNMWREFKDCCVLRDLPINLSLRMSYSFE